MVSKGVIFYFWFTRLKKVLFRSHFSMSAFRPAMTYHYLLKLLEPGGIYGMSFSCCLHTSFLDSFLFSILSHKPSVYRGITPSPCSRKDNRFYPVRVLPHSPFNRVVIIFTCGNQVSSGCTFASWAKKRAGCAVCHTKLGKVILIYMI